MEWSMGESVSIAHFAATNFFLNTGLLQPMTSVVTAINEYGSVVFGNQIIIGPNPTSNLLNIKARFNQVGNLSIQLIYLLSSVFSSSAKLRFIMEFYTSDNVFRTEPLVLHHFIFSSKACRIPRTNSLRDCNPDSAVESSKSWTKRLPITTASAV